ncbi:hypothetical protein [Dechloromonas sp. A34]|uniref:hypothetical protein n=1 Tax=Dechloromonas sp. A34 TaxID=447588 RepID=UPI0022491294|nr:hypothetical protein [Dechloromonas sp. A34]
MNKSANPAIAGAGHNTLFGQSQQAASLSKPTTSLWSYLRNSISQRLPLVAVGEIACDKRRIPVWSIATESEESLNFQCKFVRYIDMPAEMAHSFREQQVLAGKPFAGAAYVEDFQLFAELCQRKG